MHEDHFIRNLFRRIGFTFICFVGSQILLGGNNPQRKKVVYGSNELLGAFNLIVFWDELKTKRHSVESEVLLTTWNKKSEIPWFLIFEPQRFLLDVEAFPYDVESIWSSLKNLRIQYFDYKLPDVYRVYFKSATHETTNISRTREPNQLKFYSVIKYA